MRIEPYLCLAGTELANANRTLTYLRRGLAGPKWRPTLKPTASGAQSNPADLFAYCGTSSDPAYNTPQSDPAPWFDSTRVDSRDFLGLWANVEIDPVLRRDVDELDRGGGVVTRLRPKVRTLGIGGMMFAANQRGLAYGERWISEVLAGNLCRDGVAADELEVLTHCDTAGFRRLLGVGVVDGPTFTEIGGFHDCTAQEFSFQLAAGTPELFSRATTAINAVTVAPGAQTCALIQAPSWPGDVTARLVLTAPNAGNVTDITVTATPTRELTCPDTRYAPCAQYEIASLTRSERLTIDGRTRSVRRRIPASDSDVNGFSLLDFLGPFQWIDVAPAAIVCVCVSVGALSTQSLTVTLEHFLREL